MKSQWTIQKIPVECGHTIAAKLIDKIRDTEKKNVLVEIKKAILSYI